MKKIINETMLNYKILFIVIAICLIMGAGVLYRYESKTLIQDGRTHLLQTADMKALLLSNWVKERNNDAAMIMVNPRLSNDLNQWLNNRNITSKKKMIADRIKTVNHSGTYNVAALLDNAGNIIMPITGVIEDLASPTRKLAVQAGASGKITWDDLYYCDDCKKEEINIFVPLHSDEKTGSKTIAVLLLQVDANKYLIPLIRTQPASSKTNEILLLRAEELDRFKKAKYFNSVFSDDTQLERVIYSNPGSSLIGEFEYHDTKVIAAVKKVSDMPWYIAAKVDSKEAYSSLRILTLTIVFSLIFLITLLGTLIALVVANQKKDLYKRQFDMEVEQKALIKHFDYITKYSNDIFILVEEGGRIVQFNDRALTAYGYDNDEIMGMKVSDFRTDRAMTKYESDIEKAIENGGTLFETEHKCKDGSILPVEISLRSLEVEGKRYFQAIIRDITERKKAENKLRESEEKFYKAFNNSPVAMGIVNIESGKYLDINETFVNASGRSRTEIIGFTAQDIDLWDNLCERDKFYDALMLKKYVKDFPTVFKTKNGDKLHYLVSATTIDLNENRCLLFTTVNITDLIVIENKLRTSEERYRQLFENNNDAILVQELNQDGPGMFIEVNRKGENILGYSKQELSGMTMLDVTPKEHHQQLLELGRVLIKKKHISYEANGVTKNGEIIPFEVDLHLFELAGRLVVMTVARDITEKKAAEEALKESELRFRTVAQSANDAIIAADKDGLIVFWNKAACAMYGFNEMEAMGKPITMLMPEKYRETHLKRIEELQENSDPAVVGRVIVSEGLKKGGSIFPAEYSVSSWQTKSGKLFTAIVRDITERKRNEKLQTILYAISQATHSSTDLSELYEHIHEIVGELLPVENFYIALVSDDGAMLNFPYYVDEAESHQPPRQLGVGITEYVLKTKTPLLITPQLYRELQEREKIGMIGVLSHNWLGVPLIENGKTIGVLAVQSYDEKRPYSEKDKDVLVYVSDHIASAIHRKRSQDALQESEEKYRHLYEDATIGIYRTTPDGRILLANPTLVKMLKYDSFEDLALLNVEKDGYGAGRTRQDFKNEMETKGTITGWEVEWLRKDGTTVFVRENARAIRNPAGSIAYYDGVVEDITERKRAEEALQKAHKDMERTLRFNEALLSSIPTPVFFKDREGRYLGCNRAFTEIMGVTSDQIKGKTVEELWPSEYAKVYHEKDIELMANPVRQIYEFNIRDKDGLVRPVIYCKDVFRDENDQVVGIVGAFLDITERKRAENELQFRNVILTTQQETSIDGILVVDENANIVSYNHRFVEMWDVPSALVEKRYNEPVLKFIMDKVADSQSFLQRVRYLYAHQRETSRDEIVLKNESIFDSYSAPMIGPAGRYYGRVWYFHDSTARKAAVAALEMSEYRYRTTLDAVNEMIHVIDRDYNILLMNETFIEYCRDNGICKQCVGKKVFELIPFLSQSAKNEFIRVFETKKIVQSEDAVVVNGREIITKTRKIPIIENDTVVRVVTIINDITEIKRQEDAIRESREKYQRVFDNSNDGIFIIKNDTFVDCNKALLTMFAMDCREDIVGKTPETTSPEYQDNGLTSKEYGRQLIDKALSGKIQFFNWKHRKKTGEIFDCEISLSRLELKGEYYLMAILRDVTEKKESERKLRENEQRYTIVVEKTGHLVYDYDVTTGKIKWSGAVKEVTGYGSKEIEKIGIKEWEDLIHPDDKEFVLNHLEACLSTVSSFDVEYRFKRADGQYIFVLDHGVFLPGKDGKAARMLGTMSDVSERKQMDIALKQSEEKYKTLFTDTLEALSITKKGIIYDVNAAWLKLHKYDNKDEVVGRDITEILAPQDRGVIIERRERVYSNDTERIFEVRDLTKAGEIIDVEVSSSTISLDGEEAIISAIQNISQDKMNERKIRELNKRFEYVLGATKTGFDIIDASYNIHYIDPEWEKVYGNNADEKCYKYFMGRETPCEGCGVDAALRTKQTTITEEFLVKEKRWIEVHTIPFQNEDGKWLVAEFNIDLTQRKRDQKIMENRQKALQEVYKIATSLDETFQGICDRVAINLSQILDVPHMAVQLLKNGKINVISYYGEGKIENNMTLSLEGSPCEQAYQKGQPLEINGSLRQLFPKFFLNEMYDLNSYLGMPIKDRKGRVMGLICMYDYWQHFFSREEIVLLEIFAHYIGYEIERSELENNLREADKGKLLSDIASGVAHEVRNPLHAIQAITEAMAQDIEDNPNFAEYLMHIKLQVGRLSQLMKELLELGKPIPASEFKREPILGIVSTAIKYWQDTQTEQNNNVELLNNMDKDKYIYADDAKIQEVVINLLDNAAQHSPAGKAITIELTQQGHEYVTVKIIDQGSGVKPQTEERIFEPFYTTRKKGTGLGLAICKRIIESHEGNIQLTNNVDMPGCTVQFTLPVCKEEKV